MQTIKRCGGKQENKDKRKINKEVMMKMEK